MFELKDLTLDELYTLRKQISEEICLRTIEVEKKEVKSDAKN